MEKTHYATEHNVGLVVRTLRLLEETDPDSKKIITKEYDELYLKNKNGKISGLTRYETQLTWLFTLIYCIFCIIILASLIFHFK